LNIGYSPLNPKPTRKDLKITMLIIDNTPPAIGVCSRTHEPAIKQKPHEIIITSALHVDPTESRCTLEYNCLCRSCPINKTSEAKINRWITPRLKKWLEEDWLEISDQYHAAIEKDPSTTFVRVHLKSGDNNE
jgi:hypothetical protein